MNRRSRPKHDDQAKPAKTQRRGAAPLRIIGGSLRGRRLKYSGDLRTRPMKDRVREAVFNLVREHLDGYQAIDLFAGTGALGLEALSRGATRALLIEKHQPTAAIVKENVRELGLGQQARVLHADAFAWAAAPAGLGPEPWLVFCSPPFEFYVTCRPGMLSLIAGLLETAPVSSAFVVEADRHFDFAELPDPEHWDVRSYLPALVGIYYKPELSQ